MRVMRGLLDVNCSLEKEESSWWMSKSASRGGRPQYTFRRLDASKTFEYVFGREVRSLVLTSPVFPQFDIFEQDFGRTFHLKSRLGHVIQPRSQLFVASLSEIHPGSSLNLSSVRGYETDIGMFLIKVCQIVPKGLLAVFADLESMNQCVGKWKKIGLFQKMESVKPVSVEVALH